MENSRKFTKDLYVALNDTERLEITDRLVALHSEHEQVEENKKLAVDEFNAEKKAIESKQAGLYGELRRNEKLATVEVEEAVDEETKQVITRRLDTNQIIDVRRWTTQEQQRDLIFEEEDLEAVEATVPREVERLAGWLKEYEEEIGREVTEAEVRAWTWEQYRLVEKWVMLKQYNATNPEKDVVVGDTPEILLNSVEIVESDEPDEDAEPKEMVELYIRVDGQPKIVQVEAGHVPEDYASVTFYADDATVTFWDSKGEVVQTAIGKLVSEEEPDSDVPEDLAEAIVQDEVKPETNGHRDFVFDIVEPKNEQLVVRVKGAAIPKEYSDDGMSISLNIGEYSDEAITCRVVFYDANGNRVKSAKGEVVERRPNG